MTEPIKPATDEEIAWSKDRARIVTGIGSTRVLAIIARIEADRATIAELMARVGTLEDLIIEAACVRNGGDVCVCGAGRPCDEGAAILERREAESHA